MAGRRIRYGPEREPPRSESERAIVDALRRYLDAPSRRPYLVVDFDRHRGIYIQFHIRAWHPDVLVASAPGNTNLAPEDRLDEPGLRSLDAMGWSAPTSRSSGDHEQRFTMPVDLGALARLAMATAALYPRAPGLVPSPRLEATGMASEREDRRLTAQLVSMFAFIGLVYLVPVLVLGSLLSLWVLDGWTRPVSPLLAALALLGGVPLSIITFVGLGALTSVARSGAVAAAVLAPMVWAVVLLNVFGSS